MIFSLLLLANLAQAAQVTLQFDNIIRYGAMSANKSRTEIVDKIIVTLKKNNIDSAQGFWRENTLKSNPDHLETLKHWTKAGFSLGYEAKSQEPSEEWEKAVDIAKEMNKNEDFWIKSHSENALKYFSEKSFKPVKNFVSLNRWDPNDDFVRCLDKGDKKSAEQIKKLYLDYFTSEVASIKGTVGTVALGLGQLQAEAMDEMIKISRTKNWDFASPKVTGLGELTQGESLVKVDGFAQKAKGLCLN